MSPFFHSVHAHGSSFTLTGVIARICAGLGISTVVDAWRPGCLAFFASIDVPLALAQLGRSTVEPNVPYDGRFTFVRLQYTNPGRGGWAYDYPAMERNFMAVVNDLTTMRPHVRGSNILTMDDPALAKYVIAYLSEPGYWVPNAAEAAGLRPYGHPRAIGRQLTVQLDVIPFGMP